MPLKTKKARREYQRKRRAALKAARLSADPLPIVQVPAPSDPARVIAEWSASRLKVPTGPLRGKPFTLDQWQVDWLRGAMGPGILESGLSVARKNGKSGLVACLLLAYLDGPLNFPLFRACVASLTGKLAAELRDAIESTAIISGLENVRVYQSPSPGRIEGQHKARLDILAADKSSGHASGFDLVILDEAGILGENKRGLWDALLSSVSGRDGRMFCISVRGDGPMFQELRDRSGDPAVHWTEFAADPECQLDDRAQWIKANPGLASGIKSISYMEKMSRRALSQSENESSFRSLDLNLSVDPGREMICSLSDWKACLEDPGDLPPRTGECFIGFDLGGSSSMTALCAAWANGRIETWGAFPSIPNLADRGKADNVDKLYERMAERAELTVYQGRITPVSEFLRDCAARLAGERIVIAGADRFRRSEAIQALDDAALRWPMAWRGQGASATADGSHDVRSFKRGVIGGHFKSAESLLMASAISESAVRYRDGNPALDKSRSKARIDALSAAVIASGLREIHAKKKRTGFRLVVAR